MYHIDHTVLLDKFSRAGVHGNLYRWFSSYSDGRSEAVVIFGYKFTWKLVPSGVPQGSLLSQLLFIIFVIDIQLCFHNSEELLYTDDMIIL